MKKLMFALTLSLFSFTLIAQISPNEKQALIDFYVTTNGEDWVNTWDITEPSTSWYGISIENDKVTEIRLMFNNIEGQLPSSLGNLEHLKILELDFNKISGEIPTELGNLQNLELLAVNGNMLEGNIPNSIGSCSNLKELHLSSNNLNGQIPTSLGDLENLEVFNVFDNNLSGTLPIGLSRLKNLKKIVVAKNNLIVTEGLSTLLLFNDEFNDDPTYVPNNAVTPSAQSVIAIETSDDEN